MLLQYLCRTHVIIISVICVKVVHIIGTGSQVFTISEKLD